MVFEIVRVLGFHLELSKPKPKPMLLSLLLSFDMKVWFGMKTGA